MGDRLKMEKTTMINKIENPTRKIFSPDIILPLQGISQDIIGFFQPCLGNFFKKQLWIGLK